ncbi:hypothetical protein ACS0PU_012457 [Formica fusca]
MIDILNIGGEPIFDDRIVKIETHTYNPYANTTLGYSDEIRIPIHQDLYMLPCESFLYVERKLMWRPTANHNYLPRYLAQVKRVHAIVQPARLSASRIMAAKAPTQ